MSKIQMPWEDRPSGCTDVMWRYSQNPVIGRYFQQWGRTF